MSTIGSSIGLRWLIRREYVQATRFGEPIAAGISWAVTPITGRGRTRQTAGAPTYCSTRAAAFRYVAQEARRIYGRNHR